MHVIDALVVQGFPDVVVENVGANILVETVVVHRRAVLERADLGEASSRAICVIDDLDSLGCWVMGDLRHRILQKKKMGRPLSETSHYVKLSGESVIAVLHLLPHLWIHLPDGDLSLHDLTEEVTAQFGTSQLGQHLTVLLPQIVAVVGQAPETNVLDESLARP